MGQILWLQCGDDLKKHVPSKDYPAGKLQDSYGYYLYICGRCLRLYRRFYFRIEYGSERFEPDYRCGKCRGGLKPVIMDCDSRKYEDIKPVVLKDFDGNRLEWECPVCGGSGLTGRLWGFWD